MHNQGLVYIFTGDGKGKTSAALGVAIRALASGMKVAIVQWYKDPSWRISEHEIGKLLGSETQNLFSIYPLGQGFHIKGKQTAPLSNGGQVIDKTTTGAHKLAAKQALKKADSILNQVDVLILDEVNNAIADELLETSQLIDIISRRGPTHLILTGRNAHPALIELADLVTEMKKIKHPYDQGRLAVKGLDF